MKRYIWVCLLFQIWCFINQFWSVRVEPMKDTFASFCTSLRLLSCWKLSSRNQLISINWNWLDKSSLNFINGFNQLDRLPTRERERERERKTNIKFEMNFSWICNSFSLPDDFLWWIATIHNCNERCNRWQSSASFRVNLLWICFWELFFPLSFLFIVFLLPHWAFPRLIFSH